MRTIATCLGIFAALALLSGCVSDGLTNLEGKNGRIIDKIKYLQAGAHSEVDKNLTSAKRVLNGQYFVDSAFRAPPILETYVQEIARNMLQAASIKIPEPRLHVADCGAFDDVAVGSTDIILCLATLKAIRSESQLSFLLAHELAHILLGHSKTDQQLEGLQVARTVVMSVVPFVGFSAGMALTEHENSQNSVNGEREADLLALDLMSAVGANPRGAIEFLDVIEAAISRSKEISASLGMEERPPSHRGEKDRKDIIAKYVLTHYSSIPPSEKGALPWTLKLREFKEVSDLFVALSAAQTWFFDCSALLYPFELTRFKTRVPLSESVRKICVDRAKRIEAQVALKGHERSLIKAAILYSFANEQVEVSRISLKLRASNVAFSTHFTLSMMDGNRGAAGFNNEILFSGTQKIVEKLGYEAPSYSIIKDVRKLFYVSGDHGRARELKAGCLRSLSVSGVSSDGDGYFCGDGGDTLRIKHIDEVAAMLLTYGSRFSD